MNHELSLLCYLNARKDPTIDPGTYEDLEQLVHLFGLLEKNPDENQSDAPGPLTFVGSASSLLIVEDEAGLVDLLRVFLIRDGYPEAAIHTFISAETAIAFVEKQAVGIAFVDIRLVNRMAFRGAYLSGDIVTGT